MKKKLFAILLSLAMVVTMMPAMAFADIATNETPVTGADQVTEEPDSEVTGGQSALKSFFNRDKYDDSEDEGTQIQLTAEKREELGIEPNETVYELTSSDRTLSGTYIARGTIVNDRWVRVSGSATIILEDGCDVTFNYGIRVIDSAGLHIRTPHPDGSGTGKLTAKGGKANYAAIGGWYRQGAANIYIEGGNITATGANGAAGIGGGGDGGGGGHIVIRGGTVKATGGQYGAGIGGGNGGYGGNKRIIGGTVIAQGGEGAAGIGGGSRGHSDGQILIEGGTVEAHGGNGGAGIGGGSFGSLTAELIIDGGYVEAHGSESDDLQCGAGIGGGFRGNGGKVTVNGGKVKVYGGKLAAGIGGGLQGAGGDVTINGGKVETVDSNRSTSHAFGAGHGNFNNGTFNVTVCHIITVNGQRAGYYWESGNVIVETTKHMLKKAYPLVHPTINHITGENMTQGTKAYYECQCGRFYEKYENDTLSDQINDLEAWKQDEKRGKIPAIKVQVTFTDAGRTWTFYGLKGESLPAHLIPDPGKSTTENLRGWFYEKDGKNHSFCLQQPLEQDVNPVAQSMSLGQYMNSEDKQGIDGDTIDLCGIYSVSGTVNNSHRLNVLNNAAIILQDGCDLNIKGGIHVKDGCSLLILGTGTLKIDGVDENCAGIGGNGGKEHVGSIYIAGGRIAINGGKFGAGIGCGRDGFCFEEIIIDNGNVIVTGGEHAAGIGAGYAGLVDKITINGGTVIATGGEFGAGIGGCDGRDNNRGSGGSVTINGGSVTATGGNYASGIGGGREGSGGDIVINSGNVLATAGTDASAIGSGHNGRTMGTLRLGANVIAYNVSYGGRLIPIRNPNPQNLKRIKKISIPGSFAIEPMVVDGIIYNGKEQLGYINPVNHVTLSGKTSAKDPGEYKFTATPENGYTWSDGTTGEKTYEWSIARARATVKADDRTKVYGEEDPDELRATIEGTIDGDKLNYEISRESGNNVGEYKIVVTGQEVQGNYDVTFREGILKITPKNVSGTRRQEIQTVGEGTGNFVEPTFYDQQLKEDITGTLTYKYNGREMSKGDIIKELTKLRAGERAIINYEYAANGNFAGTIRGSIIFRIAGIEFTVGEQPATVNNAVTIKENPVYGDTWNQIVTIRSKDIKATLNGVKGIGRYYLNVSGRPNAGEQKQYTVLFSGSFNGVHYTNVNVLTGTVDIAKAKYTNVIKTASGKVKPEKNSSVVIELPKIPEGAKYGTPIKTKPSDPYDVSPVWGNRVTFIMNETPQNPETMYFTVPVVPDSNHIDYNITVTVRPQGSQDEFDVTVKTWNTSFLGITTYHAKITADPADKVKQISHSTTGLIFLPGDEVTSLYEIDHFYIRITAKTGRTYYYEYEDGKGVKILSGDNFGEVDGGDDAGGSYDSGDRGLDPATPISPVTPTDSTTETSDEPEVKQVVVSTTAIKGLIAYNDAFKVTWTAKKNVAGYIIQYSTNKKFKNAKKVVVTNAKAKTKKISKLKDKKEYYVRIRCYNINENGKKVYSKWSAVKSMKTK